MISILKSPAEGSRGSLLLFFFFNDTATTEIYTLSLHDALPISFSERQGWRLRFARCWRERRFQAGTPGARSEEHTSELQSRPHLVCRLLLEKKKLMCCVLFVFEARILILRIDIALPRLMDDCIS